MQITIALKNSINMRKNHPSHCTCVDCERPKRQKDLSDADKEKIDKALRKISKKTKFWDYVSAATTPLVGLLQER